ncbi:MAG: DUF2461 domain-containing protein [Pseudomonadota bacterium]
MTTPFDGETFAFFSELVDDNTREFWQANKARFDEHVKAPMDATCSALEKSFGPFKQFRMHRDVRFSKDKSPYKIHAGAVATEGGRRYFHVDRNGMLIAAGSFTPEPDKLKRLRAAIADDASGKKLQAILNKLLAKDYEIDPGLAKPLATAPRGYPKDHPRIELLRWKGLMAVHRVSAKTLAGDDAPHKRIAKVFQDAKPLVAWCEAHLDA